MKYSCCLYPKGGETLAQAEIAMLETYVKKAQLMNGMSILDLGWVDTRQDRIGALLMDVKVRMGLWSVVLR
jgi:hypothetical protein